MALKQGRECYTKWTHVESGQVLNRRLHRLEVQGQDGRLHVVTGENLPDFIQTCAGDGYRGCHLAQILLGKPTPTSYEAPTAFLWPTVRDVLHVVIGVAVVLALHFMGSVASAM